MGLRQNNRMAARARLWLPLQLEDGPRRARDLYEMGLEIGISKGMLSHVMRQLKVKTTRRRDGWWWEHSNG